MGKSQNNLRRYKLKSIWLFHKFFKMGRKSDISKDVKTAILHLKDVGLTQNEIAEEVNCSQSTVSRICRQNSNIQSQRDRCGRNKKTTARDDRRLKKLVTEDRSLSTRLLARHWSTKNSNQLSQSTVVRRLRAMGYKSRIPACKPLLNRIQKANRLQWAKAKAHWTLKQWERILFSDESKFNLSFSDKGPRVWRRRGETYLKSCVKYKQGFMVWAGMSAKGVGPLCFIKGTVNSESYQKILDKFMIPTSKKLYDGRKFIYQQDNAPPHVSNSTLKFLHDRNIPVLNWPANSPDLNPIEN